MQPPATIDGFIVITRNAAQALIRKHYQSDATVPEGPWYMADTNDIDEASALLDRAARLMPGECSLYLFADAVDDPVALVLYVPQEPQQLGLW